VEGARVISSCGSRVAKILDATSGREIASLPIGGFPDAVIYDAARRVAYIPTALDGRLVVIPLAGPANNTVATSIPTHVGARTGAVDPKTGRVFLPAADYLLPAPPGGHRPEVKPGTFQIVVVGRK
jgi:DNA-binding beta-propeller fold protein YncE